VIAALVELQRLGYEIQVDGDQVSLRWRGDGEPPRERVVPLVEEVKRRKAEVLATLTNTEMTEVVPAISANPMRAISTSATLAAPVEPCSPKVQPSGHDPAAATEDQGCGWCGSTTLWNADTGSGRIFCEACHAVYNPSTARWHDGERAKRHVMIDSGADPR
jgi:hypothetical protein